MALEFEQCFCGLGRLVLRVRTKEFRIEPVVDHKVVRIGVDRAGEALIALREIDKRIKGCFRRIESDRIDEFVDVDVGKGERRFAPPPFTPSRPPRVVGTQLPRAHLGKGRVVAEEIRADVVMLFEVRHEFGLSAKHLGARAPREFAREGKPPHFDVALGERRRSVAKASAAYGPFARYA